MTNERHERIADVEGAAMRISMVGVSGDTDREFRTMTGAISENLIQVTNNLTHEEGDVGRFARRALELIESGKCIVWVGKFEYVTTRVTAAYIYPDANSVIPALIATVDSKELLRDFKTWDQETFMSVAVAVLGLAQAFDDLNRKSPRRILNTEEFNAIFQQDPTRVSVQPLETRFRLK